MAEDSFFECSKSEAMLPMEQLECIEPDTELWAALQKMDRDGVNQLPVIRDNKSTRNGSRMAKTSRRHRASVEADEMINVMPVASVSGLFRVLWNSSSPSKPLHILRRNVGIMLAFGHTRT